MSFPLFLNNIIGIIYFFIYLSIYLSHDTARFSQKWSLPHDVIVYEKIALWLRGRP